MTVTLTAELEKLIREKITRGEYESAEALVGQAVQRLLEEETAEDDIRQRIEAAEASEGSARGLHRLPYQSSYSAGNHQVAGGFPQFHRNFRTLHRLP